MQDQNNIEKMIKEIQTSLESIKTKESDEVRVNSYTEILKNIYHAGFPTNLKLIAADCITQRMQSYTQLGLQDKKLEDMLTLAVDYPESDMAQFLVGNKSCI